MPALQTAITNLNVEFSPDRIDKFAANAKAFAPGQPLNADLLAKPGSILHQALDEYLRTLPRTFHETMRAIIYEALSASPPIPVTFAWAPGYDFELNIWHAPDAVRTRGGVTVLIKSRYPADRHPLQEGSAQPEDLLDRSFHLVK
jgi:hypothetical protein